MTEICQLCNVTGHTAQICPSLHTRCHVPNCNGVMIVHSYDDHAFLKCHRATCSGYILCSNADEFELPDFLLPCQVCGLNGHRPVDCPSSRPYHQVDRQDNQPPIEIAVYEEPISYCTRELCQICYDSGHNASVCSWLRLRCLIPNCDGVWIFHEIDANQPLQCYNRECMGYKHIGLVRHDETESPCQLLVCQLCGVHGHEVYQCPDLLSLYHQIEQEAGLFCQLCGAHTHEVHECPDVLNVYHEIEEEEAALSAITSNSNLEADVSPENFPDEDVNNEDILLSHIANEGWCLHEEFTFDYNFGCFFCDFCGEELEDA